MLAIIAQIAVGGNGSTGAVAILSLLFPSCNYIFYLRVIFHPAQVTPLTKRSRIMMAKFQQISRPMNLVETPPNSKWAISGITLWVFVIIQIVLFPIFGALVERALYGTGSTDRKLHDSETSSGARLAVRLTNFNKIYGPSRMNRFFQSCFRRKSPQVHAVKDLTLDVVHGQILSLLGANGTFGLFLPVSNDGSSPLTDDQVVARAQPSILLLDYTQLPVELSSLMAVKDLVFAHRRTCSGTTFPVSNTSVSSTA